MRYFVKPLLWLMLAGFMTGASAQGKKTKPTSEQTLLALEKERLEAIQKRDVATVERQLAEDYSLTFEEGLVFNKAQVLEMVRHRPEGHHLEWTENVKVRLYDDTAIITGHYFHEIRNPKRKSLESRYTDTYIKHNGQWYLAATQFTPTLVQSE